MIALSSPTPTLISDYEPTWQLQTITGKVVGVSDGDTITVLDASNRQHKIRLDGIDAPESSQDSAAARSKPFGFGLRQNGDGHKFEEGQIRPHARQGHARRQDINLEQIQRGMAWFYRHHAKEVRPEEPTAYEKAENCRKGRQARAVDRTVADAAVGFQARQDCESARREASGDGDGNRANHRQPQQQDLPFAELPGLHQGVGAQPRAVQDRG